MVKESFKAVSIGFQTVLAVSAFLVLGRKRFKQLTD